MLSEKYRSLLHNNIAKTYQKPAVSTKRSIDKESKHFYKMECYSDQNAYITLKDHKEN